MFRIKMLTKCSSRDVLIKLEIKTKEKSGSADDLETELLLYTPTISSKHVL